MARAFARQSDASGGAKSTSSPDRDKGGPFVAIPATRLGSNVIKGPGFRLGIDVRRVWQCPSCGRKRRVPGDVTAVRCHKPECDGVWMRLVEGPGRAPKGLQIDLTARREELERRDREEAEATAAEETPTAPASDPPAPEPSAEVAGPPPEVEVPSPDPVETVGETPEPAAAESAPTPPAVAESPPPAAAEPKPADAAPSEEPEEDRGGKRRRRRGGRRRGRRKRGGGS